MSKIITNRQDIFKKNEEKNGIKITILKSIVFVGMVAFWGCEINTAPEINDLTASPSLIGPNGTSVITCNATDADGDALFYLWEKTDGSISSGRSSVTYNAPQDSNGIYIISCTVLDGNGGEDSETVSITVAMGNTVTDIDGNVYQIVQIGDQLWMAENLKVTHYSNGDGIPREDSDEDWATIEADAYCVYDGNDSNVDTYGYLYNWYAVNDARGIAPEGWHVPKDEEIKQLEMYIGMSQSDADNTDWRGADEGGKLKSTGTIEGGDGLWYHPNSGLISETIATNESAFAALPGGYRDGDNGNFCGMSSMGCFWSFQEYDIIDVWYRKLHCNFSKVYRDITNKKAGLAVRCVRKVQ